MSSITPSKRLHSPNTKEDDGKKIQKLAGPEPEKQSARTHLGSAVFRVLCPTSRIDSVTGEGGEIISQIRQETGAKIRVDDAVPGLDERVIFIMGADKDIENNSEQIKNDKEDLKPAEEHDNVEDHVKNNGDREAHPTEEPHSDKGNSHVQKALLLVCEKILEMEQDTQNDEGSTSSTFTLRLLVLSSQIGCLLGRGGSVIKQMSNESGAQIRVLPRDKLPSCASSSDEVVQITGPTDAVKKATKSVSDQIMKNPSREQDSSPPSHSGPPSHLSRHSFPRREPHPVRGAPYRSEFRDGADYHSRDPFLFSKFHDDFVSSGMNASPEILTFRMLCPDESVGGVIGKGGAIIKAIQHDTGCDVKVLEGASNGVERVVVVSGPAHPDDSISPVQDAVLRVQARIAKGVPDIKENDVTAKLLIPSSQIGCLLGKGGSIIAEMRKVTGAYIRILGRDQTPESTSEDEVVQINGELEVVQEALLQITTRLVFRSFRDAFPFANRAPNLTFPDHLPPPPFMGRRELSPPGIFPRSGPSFRDFDSGGGLPPRGGFHPLDDHPPFMHDIHRPTIPHISDRRWRAQGPMEGGGPMGPLDHGGSHPRRMTGFGGGSHSTTITNTTAEVVVPSSLVPVIYGEDGGCLRQIRRISEARITITDPKPGAAETIVIISGSPEQTHAAQSLIQAFVISETESA